MRSLILLALFTWCATAQSSSEPPTLIRLIRSDPRDARAQSPVTVLGMNSITGLAETWLIEAHDSFGSIEDVDKATGGPPLQSRTIVLLYQPGLSYHPDQAVNNLPKARYFVASMYQIRPGTDLDFGELVKLRRAAFDSMNLDRPEIAYHAISGAPSGTYI